MNELLFTEDAEETQDDALVLIYVLQVFADI